jgi:tetratricopeptide (TPR) repeat protein
MKCSFYLLLLLSISSFGQSNQDNPKTKDLLGLINKSELQKEPFNEWFKPNYEQYIVDEAKLKPFSERLKKISIKVFLGTWCGDTKREVPKFLKITDTPWFKCEKLELICVDNGNNAHKQSPQREEKGLAILRVATFIFFENGKEIGRIVESPVVSFEQDMANILNGNRFNHNYNIGTTLLKIIDQNNGAYIENNLTVLADEWKNMVKNSSELNSLGYVLMDQSKISEAINVFKLNALIFPNVSNVYDSLAEGYEKNGDKNSAIKYYLKAVELDPKAENAIQKLKEL